ncbi:hypothetical protein ACFXKC_55010 [Streptomyces sp. NPDC059340]|uniref:hypothetical protein n=1 Tax=Streptomyces sp. NPDC059340 TaxID=3346806 RepID=UPI0036C1672F
MPAPGYPEEIRTVGSCLEVVMDEECEHLRFAVRDLATLEAASQGRVLTGSRAGRDRLTRPARPA